MLLGLAGVPAAALRENGGDGGDQRQAAEGSALAVAIVNAWNIVTRRATATGRPCNGSGATSTRPPTSFVSVDYPGGPMKKRGPSDERLLF
jgi:hypothetical protein